MADNFTQDQIQGVWGRFAPVLDDAVSGGSFSQDNVQGILGVFEPVLDEVAGAVAGRVMGALAGHGGLAGPGGLAGKRGGIAA